MYREREREIKKLRRDLTSCLLSFGQVTANMPAPLSADAQAAPGRRAPERCPSPSDQACSVSRCSMGRRHSGCRECCARLVPTAASVGTRPAPTAAYRRKVAPSGGSDGRCRCAPQSARGGCSNRLGAHPFHKIRQPVGRSVGRQQKNDAPSGARAALGRRKDGLRAAAERCTWCPGVWAPCAEAGLTSSCHTHALSRPTQPSIGPRAGPARGPCATFSESGYARRPERRPSAAQRCRSMVEPFVGH